MNWKLVYRLLVRARNVLNGWIAHARGKAYPKLAKHEPEQSDNHPVLP